MRAKGDPGSQGACEHGITPLEHGRNKKDIHGNDNGEENDRRLQRSGASEPLEGQQREQRKPNRRPDGVDDQRGVQGQPPSPNTDQHAAVSPSCRARNESASH